MTDAEPFFAGEFAAAHDRDAHRVRLHESSHAVLASLAGLQTRTVDHFHTSRHGAAGAVSTVATNGPVGSALAVAAWAGYWADVEISGESLALAERGAATDLAVVRREAARTSDPAAFVAETRALARELVLTHRSTIEAFAEALARASGRLAAGEVDIALAYAIEHPAQEKDMDNFDVMVARRDLFERAIALARAAHPGRKLTAALQARLWDECGEMARNGERVPTETRSASWLPVQIGERLSDGSEIRSSFAPGAITLTEGPRR